MTEFLDHVITVRDVLYVGIGIAVMIAATALYLVGTYRKRTALLEMAYNLRNPAYGVPKNVKWRDGRPYTIE